MDEVCILTPTLAAAEFDFAVRRQAKLYPDNMDTDSAPCMDELLQYVWYPLSKRTAGFDYMTVHRSLPSNEGIHCPQVLVIILTEYMSSGKAVTP
jgi:hypothetical protein